MVIHAIIGDTLYEKAIDCAFGRSARGNTCEDSRSDTEKRCVLAEEMNKFFRQKDLKLALALLKGDENTAKVHRNRSMPEERPITTNTDQNSPVEQRNAAQHYEALMDLGDYLTSVGKYDEAQRKYEEAALLSPDAARPYAGLVIVALQKNNLEDADIAFRIACRLDQNCAKAYAGLAMIEQQRKHYSQACKMYLKCLELESDNLTALLGLFQTSCQIDSFEKTIHYLRIYLDMHPGDRSVMIALAALYMNDGRSDEAREILRNVLALEPGHKDATDLLEKIEHGQAKQRQAEVAGPSTSPG
jgi:tetratricopeptide (TPR) repeat protein